MAAPYRDDDDALRARLRSLTDQMEVGQARAKELRDLEEDGGKLEREIAGIRKELDRREAKRQKAAAGAVQNRRMGRRVALAAVGSGVLAGAWMLSPRAPGPSPAPPISSGIPSQGPPPLDPVLAERLGAGAVYHDRYARRVLWSWTSAEQVAELARTPLLLTRARSGTKGPAFFDKRREMNHASLAQLFGEPALARRRFAWSSPWPTVRGLSAEETYGDRLIRVSLRRESVMAYFGGKDSAWWTFQDLEGRVVDIDEVMRHPKRIAAAFHVFDGEGSAAPYREYVLCNESMIEEWSVATPEIQAEVSASVDLLRRLRAAIERDPPDVAAMDAGAATVAQEVWAHPGGAPSLAALYEANLAFANPRYRLDAETLDAMIAALAALPAGDPLRHRPTVKFAGFKEGAQATSTSPVWKGNALPSMLPKGWPHAVKCVPFGSFGCTPLGQPDD